MDPDYQSTWVQIVAGWGAGPIVIGILGIYQWWRDRADRLDKQNIDYKRDEKHDLENRDAAIDASFDRLSKDQQDYITNLKQDRDSVRKRCDELEAENRRIHETIWNVILWGRDMRNAAITARIVSDQQGIRLGETPHLWLELPEWKN